MENEELSPEMRQAAVEVAMLSVLVQMYADAIDALHGLVDVLRTAELSPENEALVESAHELILGLVPATNEVVAKAQAIAADEGTLDDLEAQAKDDLAAQVREHGADDGYGMYL